ncbi:MAG: 3-methyl-2-oxobutanoate hydroxymethyltransferase, partial [Halobacteriales archaeon]|nr:3-methyl-2-oxobutanoate hydroxymethyltransferase [Halobacteriales archaeon]
MPTIREIQSREPDDPPITMLTAYDSSTAAVVDQAGIDMILVGDTMGQTVLGYDSTLPVTVDEMASRTGAVVRATEEAIIVADLPFLSYGVDQSESIVNAGRMLKEEGAKAVKLESGPHTVEVTERLTQLGIPVMAHLGLTPQHVNLLGGYFRQGTEADAADRILELARAHEEAGAFSVVLEHMPASLGRTITEELAIPTIGIGAGPDTDGQVLILHDIVGLSDRLPPFAKQFGDVKGELERAIGDYRDAVIEGEVRFDGYSRML